MTRLEPIARDWEASVSSRFLTEYLQTTAQTRLAPANRRRAGQWLDAFLLEKVLYELRYELSARPLWVDIPVLEILRILNAPGRLTSVPR